MNSVTEVPAPVPITDKLALEDIDCCFTLKACAYLTGDAFMCIPCCFCCGGCCGRFSPCISNMGPDFSVKPGTERLQANCYIQIIAAMLMPMTLCGCLWGCCGICTPCVRGVAQCTMGVESRANAKAKLHIVTIPPNIENGMVRL